MPTIEEERSRLEQLLGKTTFKDMPEYLEAVYQKFLGSLQQRAFEDLADLVDLAELGSYETMLMNRALKSRNSPFPQEQMQQALLYLVEHDRVGTFRKARLLTFMTVEKVILPEKEVQAAYARWALQGNYDNVYYIKNNTAISPIITNIESLTAKYNEWAREGKGEVIAGIAGVCAIKPEISPTNAQQGYQVLAQKGDYHNVKILFAHANIRPRFSPEQESYLLGMAAIERDFAYAEWAMQTLAWKWSYASEIYLACMLRWRTDERTLDGMKKIYALTHVKPDEFGLKLMEEHFTRMKNDTAYQKIKEFFLHPRA